MKLFLLIFMLVCKQTKSLQDSTKSDGASFYSFKIDRLNNDVNIVGIDSSIYSCATQCLSGCSRCESECESSCNKNKNETAQSQDFEKSSSILSKSKVFKFFFNFQKFNELFNHSRKYWRKDQHLLIEIDDISDKCSSTKVAACTTGCQSICSVCEYECGLSCIPDEETNSEIVNLVKNQVVSKLDKSQVSIVCNDTCNAMCSYCKCDCLSYCQDHQSILTTKTCDEFCGTQCKNLCSSPSGLSECGNNCLSKVSSHATNDHDMNDGTWSETWGIHEDGTVTWTSEQLGNDPEVEFSCEEKCGTTCVSQCESSCALGNPFNNDGSGLNKNGIITPASWYSLRLKIFELFMNRKSGVSSVLRTSFEDFKPNDNCGLVKESACRPTCETICSFCQTQCKVYQDYSNSISEQIENHGGWNGSVVLQNYQELVDSMYSELNGICDDVCGNMCSTCQCLCESECAKNLAELALANKTQNIDIESRCATTCEDSCGTCDFDCNSACNALDQRTNDTLGTDESSQVSPPVRTKLSFDMHTRIAGEGLSVTIYFIVVEDGMRMYCDTTALPGTTAANIWSQKMASTLDNENNDVNDIHDYDHHDSDNTTIHQDVDIITNDGNFGVEHDEDITNQFEGARKSQIRAGACHESMPNIYVLKDKSCCGFPSLPQCKAVNARKLGCVDKLGKYHRCYEGWLETQP